MTITGGAIKQRGRRWGTRVADKKVIGTSLLLWCSEKERGNMSRSSATTDKYRWMRRRLLHRVVARKCHHFLWFLIGDKESSRKSRRKVQTDFEASKCLPTDLVDLIPRDSKVLAQHIKEPMNQNQIILPHRQHILSHTTKSQHYGPDNRSNVGTEEYQAIHSSPPRRRCLKKQKERDDVELKAADEKRQTEEESARIKVDTKELFRKQHAEVGIMNNIFIKPRPPLNTTATSQKPPVEPTSSSSYSTNRPSKELKSSAKCSHSIDFKLLEAKIDLILDLLAKPPSAPTPDLIVTSSIILKILKRIF
ncbi:unnamed protein product [Lactuca saligna]|uniref:Uncharacterized protein n=1 Tax=Lactuca saligna TaxID=75948 RepID=A0AA35ZQN2_LACSI|nr:unnamed protein product [Lactuca saligna]